MIYDCARGSGNADVFHYDDGKSDVWHSEVKEKTGTDMQQSAFLNRATTFSLNGRGAPKSQMTLITQCKCDAQQTPC